jgi:hypothetical protein
LLVRKAWSGRYSGRELRRGIGLTEDSLEDLACRLGHHGAEWSEGHRRKHKEKVGTFVEGKFCYKKSVEIKPRRGFPSSKRGVQNVCAAFSIYPDY